MQTRRPCLIARASSCSSVRDADASAAHAEAPEQMQQLLGNLNAPSAFAEGDVVMELPWTKQTFVGDQNLPSRFRSNADHSSEFCDVM